MTIQLDTDPPGPRTPRHRPRRAPCAGLLDGRVHLPGDPGYDAARLPWNVAVDQRPAAVAFPRTAAEVSAVVRVAAEAACASHRRAPATTPVRSRRSGLDDVVVVRTSEMATAVADPARGIVRVEGGAIWEPAVEAAAAHGRAVLHGSSPDVGIAGYSLGGGIGWYARKLGLATNSLTAVELVVADGTLVRADAETNRELFWAVRGGGGNFGVVTALEFAMFDIQTVYAGMLMWQLRDIEPVLREWAAWAPGAPDEVTTAFRAMRLPDMPDLPGVPARTARWSSSTAPSSAPTRAARSCSPGCARSTRSWTPSPGCPPRRWCACTWTRRAARRSPPTRSCSGRTRTPRWTRSSPRPGPDARTSLLMAELRQLGGALGRPHEGGGVLTASRASSSRSAAVSRQPPRWAPGPTPTPCGSARRSRRSRTAGSTLNFAENPIDTRSVYDAGAGGSSPASAAPSTRTACSSPTTRPPPARERSAHCLTAGKKRRVGAVSGSRPPPSRRS